MFPSYLDVEKTGSQLFRSLQTELQLLEREKSGYLLLFGKEKDDDSKSQKTGSQQLGPRKKCFPAIWKQKKLVPTYLETDKHCCSYLER